MFITTVSDSNGKARDEVLADGSPALLQQISRAKICMCWWGWRIQVLLLGHPFRMGKKQKRPNNF
jgi:hypothetical protein